MFPPGWLNFLILALALVWGGWFRFYHLAASEMSADEAASWTVAAAPTVGQAILLSLTINPGKLGVHDLMLHFWMRAFGDSLLAIRALSAILGTFAIGLVFVVVRELFPDGGDRASALAEHDGDSLAALSALVLALNLVAIRYLQERRMYPLMLDATFLQTWCFLRAFNRGGLMNYAGSALFAVLAIGTNFTVMLVFFAEGLWLLDQIVRGHHRANAFNLMISLAAAGATLAALIPWSFIFHQGGYFSWMQSGFMTAYVWRCFGAAAHRLILPVVMGLAVFGAIRGLQARRDRLPAALDARACDCRDRIVRARFLVLADSVGNVQPESEASLRREFPAVVTRLRGVSILQR